MIQWQYDFYVNVALFNDLSTQLKQHPWLTWPSCEALMRLFDAPAYTTTGHKVQFLPQNDALPYPELYYEQRIYQTGIVSTRLQNWHDLFNAMIWVLFPRTKAIINAQHVTEMATQKTQQRSMRRDALTLFDECGVLLASADHLLIEALYHHHWKQFFYEAQDKWHRDIKPFIFGHALYEKALSPYIGFTAKALVIAVEADFFDQSLTQQYHYLDRYFSNEINTKAVLLTPKCLTPFPMLGVPGWWCDNDNPLFYDNTDYFRPKERA